MAVAMAPQLSVVVPVRNEEDVLPLLVPELRQALDALSYEWEVVLVDDGSDDTTYERAVSLHESDPRFKLVKLSRNFGHQIAISVGLDLAEGDAVVTMDGDLQHPPAVIADFVSRWRDGYEVVYGVMVARAGETRFKRWSARVFYSVLGKLAKMDVPSAAGDFRLIDRRVVESVRAMRESHRYLRGMFSWVGFTQIGVPFESPPRPAGQSKYTRVRMFRLAADAVIGFSDRPLRLGLNVGFGVSIASIVFGVSALVSRLAGVFVVPGWTSIMVLVGVVGGMQLIVLGVIGEYVGRTFDEVKQRPLYVISRMHGFPEEAQRTWG